MTTSYILSTRRDKQQEYFVNLFEYCNMRCSFCWQDHDDKTGMLTIVDKADIIFEQMLASHAGNFSVNLMGGELFSDDIDDSLFDAYKELVVQLVRKVHNRGFLIEVNWVTNLVYDDCERVSRLVDFTRKFCPSHITTSYDPTGRFNTETFNIFKRNLRILGKDYVRTIGIVLTKQNIEHFLKGRDPFIDEFKDDFEIFFDHYSPEHNADKITPKDSELFRIFKYLIDNYPTTAPAREWISRREQQLSCKLSRIVGPEGDMGQCGSLVPEKLIESFEVPVETHDNSAMEEHFINENECLTCEYYQVCGLGCFLLHNYKGRRDLDECVFKKTYDYAKARRSPNGADNKTP